MRLVDAPKHLPGCCFICGTTPPGPYVDLERRAEKGWAYLCMFCASQIAKLIPGEEASDAEETPKRRAGRPKKEE